MDVKPIETVYNGYRFRSRLEARWAVFFDAIGAEWEYEPEGFEFPDGTRYLPDFRIKNVKGRGVRDRDAKDIYVEVKGNLTSADLHKLTMFCGWGDDQGYPVILFGQIPGCEWVEPHWDSFLGETVGGHWSFDYTKDNDDHFYNLEFSEGDCYNTEPKAAYGGGLVLDYPDDPYVFVDNALTAKAYTMARQARFEHGNFAHFADHC